MTSGPPPTGARWPAQELQAGLAVLNRVRNQPFAHQITGVSVENYGASPRHDRWRLEVLTTHPGCRILWGRPPGEEEAAENSADQKIALLAAMFESQGRIDFDRGYVDITIWPNRVITPASDTHATDLADAPPGHRS